LSAVWQLNDIRMATRRGSFPAVLDVIGRGVVPGFPRFAAVG